MVFVQNFYRARDHHPSAVALHARGRDEDADGSRATLDCADDVAKARAGRAGDDADAPRQERQFALERLVEETFGEEPLLQLLEGDAQRARADGVERLDHQLVLAARLVDREPTAHAHQKAVGRAEAYAAVDAAEACGAQLRALVAHREVPVAGRSEERRVGKEWRAC